MKNILLEKRAQGKKTLGTFSHLPCTPAIECLRYTGLDYVIIDAEHGGHTIQSATAQFVAAKAAGLMGAARVPEVSRGAILSMLDYGAQMIIVPCIDSVAQAKEIISYAKYAPMGNRGFCPTRAGEWGLAPHAPSLPDYMRAANEQTLLIPQCETLGFLENMEQIIALEGIDGVLIGPFDLSIALGRPGEFDHPAVKGAIARALDACKAHGKLSIIFTASTAAASAYFAQGFDSVAFGVDALSLSDAYLTSLAMIER